MLAGWVDCFSICASAMMRAQTGQQKVQFSRKTKYVSHLGIYSNLSMPQGMTAGEVSCSLQCSLSMRVSAFISLALVVVLVLHTVLYDIRLNMSNLPSIYTDHSYTLNIYTYRSLSLSFILRYYNITV